ncbi:MAG: endonuclease/exonuclease/phosphatase family protein, partial [Myxococcales bacterium]
LRIREELAWDPLPKVLLGDFNDVPGSLMHRAVRSRLVDVFKLAGEGRGGTFPLVPKLVTPRIDYIFASPELTPTHAKVIRTRASDHHILTAEVEVRAARVHERQLASGA